MENPRQNGNAVFEESEDSSKTVNVESNKYNTFVEFDEKSNHFKEVGFWCGVGNTLNPQAAFKVVIEEHLSLNKQRRAELNILHRFDIDRFEKQIQAAELETKEIQRRLEEQQNSIPDLQDEVNNLRDKIKGFETELAAVYKQLGDAKAKLIDKRIEDAFNELDTLIARYQITTRKHSEVTEEARSRNSVAFEIKPDLLRQLQSHYNDAFNRIQQKAVNLGLGGNWLSNPWTLRSMGLLAALSAGYFFSIFAIEGNLSNLGIPFFIITGLFNFFGSLTQYPPWGYVLAISIVLLLPFIVLLISYFCQKALEKHRQAQEKNLEDFKIVLNENDEIQIAETDESKDFYSFLLKRTPSLFLVSLLFALVTFGYFGAVTSPANTQLQNLDTSLSSFIIGVSLCLAIAGIIYIYILNVVEPRLERINANQNNETARNRRFLGNFELVLIILGTLTLLFGLLVGLEKSFFFNISKAMVNKKAFVALLFFIVSVLISALTFGYGMYYSGIIEAKNNIERKLKFLTQKLAFNSFPSIRPILLADKAFGMKYVEIVNKLLRLISAKTDLAGRFIPKTADQARHRQAENSASRFSRFLPDFLKKYFADKRSEFEKLQDDMAEIDQRIHILPEDEHYFPEIASEINSLGIRIKEDRKRLLITEADIRNRQEEKTDYITQLKENKHSLEEKIKDWKKYISFLNREQFKEIERFNRKLQKEISELNDGFNTALWFVDNGGKPPLLYSGMIDPDSSAMPIQEVEDEPEQ